MQAGEATGTLNPDERVSRTCRIAVVEDHRLQRLRTDELLNQEPGLRVVYSTETLPELILWLRGRQRSEVPDLLVLDLIVDRGTDADPALVAALVKAGIKVLVLSAMASPPMVREVLRAGVGAVVSKQDTEADIIEAVWAVIRGQEWMTADLAAVIAGDDQRPKLSEQEERALVLYASGLTLDGVAAAIGVKRDTAKTYLDRVKRKYAEAGEPVQTKLDLSRVAIRDGYVALESIDLRDPLAP